MVLAPGKSPVGFGAGNCSHSQAGKGGELQGIPGSAHPAGFIRGFGIPPSPWKGFSKCGKYSRAIPARRKNLKNQRGSTEIFSQDFEGPEKISWSRPLPSHGSSCLGESGIKTRMELDPWECCPNSLESRNDHSRGFFPHGFQEISRNVG